MPKANDIAKTNHIEKDIENEDCDSTEEPELQSIKYVEAPRPVVNP